MNLAATLATSEQRATFLQAAKLTLFSSLPARCWVDEGNISVDRGWIGHILGCRTDARAHWADEQHQLGLVKRNNLVVLSAIDAFSTLEEALAILEPLPFELCALGSVFFDEWIEADYEPWGFSRGHISHGWGCLFRGVGHDRLVSRRWLEFGPWRLIKLANDTSFVQFHDLAITDPAEAHEQAKVGHERMGISQTGGFIQQIERWMFENLRFLYFPNTRVCEILVPFGETVSQWKMQSACIMRLQHRLARPAVDPIERVAYVFLEEENARAHLHELWLRELECWVVDGKGKRRLDQDYHPVPQPPDWVRRLDAR